MFGTFKMHTHVLVSTMKIRLRHCTIKLQWVEKGGLWSASFSNRYVHALPQCVLRCSGVFADMPVSNVCATVCIWGLISFSLDLFPSLYLCCSGLDGEQIYSPCPYRMRPALFLQLCRAILAWLWRRVTVRDVRRRKGAKVKHRDCFPPPFLFSFFFLLSFPLFFLLLPDASMHTTWRNSSNVPCCNCKRVHMRGVADWWRLLIASNQYRWKWNVPKKKSKNIL